MLKPLDILIDEWNYFISKNKRKLHTVEISPFLPYESYVYARRKTKQLLIILGRNYGEV